MSIRDQGEELSIEEEVVFRMYWVDPSFCQIGATDVEAHGEAIDNHRSDLESLALGAYHEG